MGVITVGKLQAGETGNVMAGSASMLGTIRANHNDIRSKLLERIPQVADGTARASGAIAKTKLIEIYPVTDNDPELAGRITKELTEYGDPKDAKNAPNNHSDKFSPDESAMPAGVRAHIAAAMTPVK